MFERYTEKARRVIFFARYEASQFGSPYIETEHILLGLIRENKALSIRFLRVPGSVELIRKQIEGHTTIGEKVSTSVDLPLSNESKRVLAFAAEEAERLSHKRIGTEHLLLGMLREEKCFAAEILHDLGLRLSSVREELVRNPHQAQQTQFAQSQQGSQASSLLSQFCRDLIQAALDDQLDPVVARDDAVNALIEVLGQRTRNNPVLVGESGVGKTAIVEALAQRIADGNVSQFMSDKRVFSVDLSALATGCDRAKFEQRLAALFDEAAQQGLILFLPDVAMLLLGNPSQAPLGAASPLQSALSRNLVPCISEATPEEYQSIREKNQWYVRCSQPVPVAPLSEAGTLQAVHAMKEGYEKFHAVSYKDEAIEAVAADSKGDLRRAGSVLDAAGTRVKLQCGVVTQEIAEVQRRIKFIVHRMESSIANHEFEKARFYSDEERKERTELEALYSKNKVRQSPGEVTRDDVQQAIARVGDLPD